MSGNDSAPGFHKKAAGFSLLFHYVATALIVIQGFVLTPLCLHYISPSLYGAWLASGNILAWIQLVDPGFSRVTQQRVAFFLGAGDRDRIGRVIGTSSLIGVLLAAVPMLAWPLAGGVGGMFGLPPAEASDLALSFQLALLGTMLMLAASQQCAAIVGLQLSLATGAVYTGAAIVGIVLTVALLLLGYGLPSIPLGLAIRALCALAGYWAVLWWWCRRNLPGKAGFSREELRQLSGPMGYTLLGRLGSTLAGQLDMLIAARLLSPVAATVYAMTSRGFDLVHMIPGRVAPAVVPAMAHLAGQGDRVRTAAIAARLLGIVTALVAAGVGLVVAVDQRFVTVWVGAHLFGGNTLAVLVGINVALSVLCTTYGEFVYSMGAIGKIEIARLVEAFIRLALVLFFVLWLGLVGLPLGAIAAQLLVSAWYFPLVAGKLVGRAASDILRDWSRHLLRLGVVVLAGCGALMAVSRLPVPHGWVTFGLLFGATGVLMAAITYAVHAPIRGEAAALWARLSFRK